MGNQDQGTLLEVEKVDHRRTAVDLIFTVMGKGGLCCIASMSGLKYGTQSGKGVGWARNICPYAEIQKRHVVTFIDNDYFAYDHERHRSTVEKWKPKYATVRDYVSEAEARQIADHTKYKEFAYYPIEQIIEWAVDLHQYAEEIIVIPKAEYVIDKIPEEFVLGYSIPTSHGGTTIPVEAFQGRRLHLLGGSWRKQWAFLQLYGEQVVSLDNNYLLLLAKRGQFVLPEGDPYPVNQIGITTDTTRNGRTGISRQFTVANPLMVATALSVGNVLAAVKRLYGLKFTPLLPQAKDRMLRSIGSNEWEESDVELEVEKEVEHGADVPEHPDDSWEQGLLPEQEA